MTINGYSYSTPKNIHVKQGAIMFGGTFTTTPFNSTSNGLFVNSSNQLVYSAQGVDTTLGSAGSLVNFSLNDAYDDGASITVDSTAVTLAGAHATNNVFAITLTGTGTGNLIDLQNNSSGSKGYDIIGTGDTWSISSAGVAVLTGVTIADDNDIILGTDSDITIEYDEDGNDELLITGATGISGNVNLRSTSTFTQAGNAGNTVFTITAGDVVWSDASLSITDADNAETVTVINNTATTIGNATSTSVFQVESTSLTTGALMNLQLTEETLNGGWYFRCWDATAAGAVFAIAENGATTIAGSAEGTDALTITAGDLRLTDGALIITAGAFTYTAGDMAMSDGSITIVDADNAATFSLTNNTATSASVVVLAGSGVFTGSTTTSWMTITPSGLTSGTGVYLPLAALTTGKGLHITSGATQTTGSLLYVQDTGANSAITSGTVATFDLTSTAITGSVNKIGNGVTVSSSRTTTTGTVADDWDLLSVVRTDIINGAGSMSAAGSVLYVENAVTNTSGTVTDTANGIEVVMDSLGTGAGVKVTHAATGGIALSVIGAATTVDDVLIATTGAKADNKGALQVTNSGATAAGGSILRVINTGTPAAATSYLVDFDYTGATLSNNPVAMILQSGASTASTMQITDSGAKAAGAGTLELINTNAGALGAVLKLYHSSASPADNDVVGRIDFYGTDDGPAAQQMAKIDIVATDVTAGTEDADIIFYTAVAGTVTQVMRIDSDVVGLLVGSGAAAATISSDGAYDLTISTASTAANEPKIVLTDGAAGDITITAGGTSGEIVMASPVVHSTVQTISNANTAIDVVTDTTSITNDAPSTHTLADGVVGQRKYIFQEAYTGDAVITPANLADGTTITLNAAGDAWYGEFVGTEWHTIALVGTAAIA